MGSVGCSSDEVDAACGQELTARDGHEPDDSFDTAKSLAPGVDSEHTIHCASGSFNPDFVRLATEPGRVYTFPSVTLLEGTEPLMETFAPDGSALPQFEHIDIAKTWLAPESGDYRLRFSAGWEDPLLEQAKRSGGRFGVRFEAIEGDAFEPDDTIASAKPAALGTIQERTLTWSADRDVVRVEVQAGQKLQVFVPPDGLGSSIVPVVEILDGAGKDVAAGSPNWRTGAPSPGQCCAGGFWTAPADGTFFVRFSHDRTTGDFYGPRPYKLELSFQ